MLGVLHLTTANGGLRARLWGHLHQAVRALLVCAGLWLCTKGAGQGQPHPDLLARSRVVYSVGSGPKIQHYDHCWWKSDDTLVIQRPTGGYPGAPDATSEFLERNVVTGTERSLVPLGAAYARTGSQAIVKPSPDGRRVWWYKPDAGAMAGDVFYCCGIDGNGFTEVGRGSMDLFWATDSARLLSVSPISEKIETAGVDIVRKQELSFRMYSISPLAGGQSHVGTLEGDVFFESGFVAQSGRFVSFWWGRAAGHRSELPVAEIDPVTGLQRTWFARPPSGRAFEEFVDPARERLAWHVSEFDVGGARLAESLWVSKLDGSEAHEVGRIEISPPDASASGYAISHVMWTPSGRYLSFVLNRQLRVALAE